MNLIDVIYNSLFIYFSFCIYALNLGSLENNKSILIILLLLTFVMLFVVAKRKTIIYNKYFIIYSSFVLLCFLSKIWSINQNYTQTTLNSLLLTYSFVIILVNIITNEKYLFYLIRSFAFAGLFMFLYLMLKYGLFYVVNIRSINDSGITILNANDLGLKYIISAFCTLLYKHHYKRKNKIYNIILILYFILALLTSSKKVLLLIIICFILPKLYQNRKRKIFNGFFIVIILLIVYYIVMYIPFIYNSIGIRFEEIISLLNGSLISDTSTSIRWLMIEKGFNLFLEKPYLGYGIGCSLLLNNGTYFHNNYIELLFSLGIIGTILYYCIYLKILKDSIYLWKNYDVINSLYIMFFIIGMFVIDFALVSYNFRPLIYLLAIFAKYNQMEISRLNC